MTKIKVLIVASGFALVGWTSAVAAQPADTYRSPETLPRDLVRPTASGQPPSVVKTADPGDANEELPVTGGDMVGLAAIGAGAIVVGSALQLRRRRGVPAT